jgi:hypothetical protein
MAAAVISRWVAIIDIDDSLVTSGLAFKNPAFEPCDKFLPISYYSLYVVTVHHMMVRSPNSRICLAGIEAGFRAYVSLHALYIW